MNCEKQMSDCKDCKDKAAEIERLRGASEDCGIKGVFCAPSCKDHFSRMLRAEEEVERLRGALLDIRAVLCKRGTTEGVTDALRIIAETSAPTPSPADSLTSGAEQPPRCSCGAIHFGLSCPYGGDYVYRQPSKPAAECEACDGTGDDSDGFSRYACSACNGTGKKRGEAT